MTYVYNRGVYLSDVIQGNVRGVHDTCFGVLNGISMLYALDSFRAAL